MAARRRVRDLGGALRFAHLRRLGVPLEDLEQLSVASGTIVDGGHYVEAETGESRLLQAGDLVPLGIWVAQRDITAIVEGGEPTADPTLEDDRAASSPDDEAVAPDRDRPPIEREVLDGRGDRPATR